MGDVGQSINETCQVHELTTCQLSNEKNSGLVGVGWFRYVGDEQLPSFVG